MVILNINLEGRNNTMFKSRFLTLALLVVSAAGLAACNTVDGAGQDIENAGESVQDAAN